MRPAYKPFSRRRGRLPACFMTDKACGTRQSPQIAAIVIFRKYTWLFRLWCVGMLFLFARKVGAMARAAAILGLHARSAEFPTFTPFTPFVVLGEWGATKTTWETHFLLCSVDGDLPCIISSCANRSVQTLGQRLRVLTVGRTA